MAIMLPALHHSARAASPALLGWSRWTSSQVGLPYLELSQGPSAELARLSLTSCYHALAARVLLLAWHVPVLLWGFADALMLLLC
jgi:hypothetical protein